MKTVKVYSTSSCPWCVRAKEYLRKKNIPFDDIDVGRDVEKAKEMVKISGQMGVPVITVDNEVVIGFDQNKLEQLLGIG
ncbi:MAG: glutaredoxin domain-containing protein [Planctomycetota bacterium]